MTPRQRQTLADAGLDKAGIDFIDSHLAGIPASKHDALITQLAARASQAEVLALDPPARKTVLTQPGEQWMYRRLENGTISHDDLRMLVEHELRKLVTDVAGVA